MTASIYRLFPKKKNPSEVGAFDPNFCIVQFGMFQVFLDLKPNGEQLRVFFALALKLKNKGYKNVFRVKQETLAKQLKTSQSNISRALKFWVDNEVIIPVSPGCYRFSTAIIRVGNGS